MALNDTEPRANPAARPAQALGQWLYAVFAFVLALFLLASLPFQTTYFANFAWFKQPRLWPAIAIVGMLVAGAGHLLRLRKFQEPANALAFSQDLRLLIAGFEFVAWFILYVYLVGWLGYLPSSLLFAWFITWRIGHRRARSYVYAAVLAIAIVLIFKGFLQVKIPGGELYDYLPASTQRFAKSYL